MSDLTNLLSPYRTISIIGIGKNAGKTTTLNYLIREFSKKDVRLALTSIGRDGEDVDVVTKTEKPRIFVMAGTIVITTEKLLALCDITAEILMVTSINTPLGRVVVVRACSDGFVQLGGPSITAQMAVLLTDLQEFNPDKIIIDGAISRKSLANPALAQAALLCSGAGASSNMNEIIDQTRHAVAMLMLTVATANGENDIYLPGAVSDRKMRELVMSGANLARRQIIIDDASKIFITPATYEKLLIKGAALAVRTPINLVAVTINPVSPRSFVFDAQEFLAKMRAALPVPVYDIVGGDSCV